MLVSRKVLISKHSTQVRKGWTFGVAAEIQLGMPVSLVLGLEFKSQLPVMGTLGGRGDDSSSCVPVTHVGSLDHVPSS